MMRTVVEHTNVKAMMIRVCEYPAIMKSVAECAVLVHTAFS